MFSFAFFALFAVKNTCRPSEGSSKFQVNGAPPLFHDSVRAAPAMVSLESHWTLALPLVASTAMVRWTLPARRVSVPPRVGTP